MSVEVTGIDELMSMLSQMSSEEFADGTLMEGLMLAGKQVQATAKQLCPVDTGRLRNSIVVTQMAHGVDVGTDVEYAVYNEYGTGKRGNKSAEGVNYREDWAGMSPRPFLYPALKANEENVHAIVKDTLRRKIDALRRQ